MIILNYYFGPDGINFPNQLINYSYNLVILIVDFYMIVVSDMSIQKGYHAENHAWINFQCLSFYVHPDTCCLE